MALAQRVMGSNMVPQVQCDVVTWQLFGLSLATYNALGKLNYAAAAGTSDFVFAAFLRSAGLSMTLVPYRDVVQAPNDLAEGRIQVLASDLPGPDRAHPGRCLPTVFDVRSLYVAQDSVTAEVFGDQGCRFGRRSTVVSATAPQAPGNGDIRTGSPMRSIDAYRNP